MIQEIKEWVEHVHPDHRERIDWLITRVEEQDKEIDVKDEDIRAFQSMCTQKDKKIAELKELLTKAWTGEEYTEEVSDRIFKVLGIKRSQDS